MFYYELVNHEYGFTGDAEDTLEALGYTMERVQANQCLRTGFELACKKIMEEKS